MSDTTPDTDTANNSDQPKSWRDALPVHPAAELFPLMSEAELRELGENIKARGGRLIQAVHLYKGQLLDGRNRLDAMELVGFTFDDGGLNGLAHNLPDSVDPYEYVIAANLHRRHLTAEQKRELIAKVLKAKPEQSNRTIAKQVKADDKTVAKVRSKLESTAEIPQLKKTKGNDGKARLSRRHTPKPAPWWAPGGVLPRGVSGPDKAVSTPASASASASASAEPTSEAAPEDSAVADPATVEDNALYALARINAHAKLFNKVFKLSSFDREATERISTAIERMIAKWRSTQATLTKGGRAGETDPDDQVLQ